MSHLWCSGTTRGKRESERAGERKRERAPGRDYKRASERERERDVTNRTVIYLEYLIISPYLYP